MILFRLTLPPDSGENERMYVRPAGAVSYGRELRFGKHATVSLDTYYNAFSVTKYQTYTQLHSLKAVLLLQGRFAIRAHLMQEGNEQELILKEQLVHRRELSPVPFPLPIPDCRKKTCMLYLELESLEEGGLFGGGWYQSEDMQTQKVRCAVIICTYKREDYLQKNLSRLQKSLSEWNIKEELSFLVIDNGNTLDPSQYNSRFVTVYPNRNLGGSGGFTRGLMEAMDARPPFTHVILMDDDVVIDANVLLKAIQFLSLLKPQYCEVSLSGAMLYLREPYRQFEAGGVVDGLQQTGLGHFLDLRERENILENEQIRRIDYGGWWFMCMPMTAVQNELPLPFFIKYDDVEYALRQRLHILTLNGVCVLHEQMEDKYSSVLEYYNRRNFWILHSLHGPAATARTFIKQAAIQLTGQFFRHQYTAVETSLLAYRDFLKGPARLAQIRMDELHQSLLQDAVQFLPDWELLEKEGVAFQETSYVQSLSSRAASGRLLKLFRGLTCNGYLIPKLFYPKEPLGYRVADALYDNTKVYFLADKVLHYNVIAKKGYVTRIRKRMLLRLPILLFRLAVEAGLWYHKAVEGYREQAQSLTSREAWEKRLKE